jgi:hypothetical protein
MSKNIYRTAQGKMVNMDTLRIQNEEAIALGNMKINARGDELGPGGVVVRTRDQVMKEYYDSNAVYTKERVQEKQQSRGQQVETAEPEHVDFPSDILEQDAQMPDPAELPKLRGNLADAVAKTAKVEQKLLQPKKPTNSGPSRI